MQFNTSVLFSANLRSCTVFIDNSCVYQISASGCEIRRSNLESAKIQRSVLYYYSIIICLLELYSPLCLQSLKQSFKDSFATLLVIVATEYIMQSYSLYTLTSSSVAIDLGRR